MRIALFTETFLPKVDGIVTRLKHTVEHLQRLGHDVMVFQDPDAAYHGLRPRRGLFDLVLVQLSDPGVDGLGLLDVDPIKVTARQRRIGCTCRN